MNDRSAIVSFGNFCKKTVYLSTRLICSVSNSESKWRSSFRFAPTIHALQRKIERGEISTPIILRHHLRHELCTLLIATGRRLRRYETYLRALGVDFVCLGVSERVREKSRVLLARKAFFRSRSRHRSCNDCESFDTLRTPFETKFVAETIRPLTEALRKTEKCLV